MKRADYERMTWGEFKRRMEAAGAKDDSPIHYIDVYKPRAGEDFILGGREDPADGRVVDSNGVIDV